MSIFERKIVTLLTLGRAMFIDKFKKNGINYFKIFLVMFIEIIQSLVIFISFCKFAKNAILIITF